MTGIEAQPSVRRCIVPPDLLAALAVADDPQVRAAARSTLVLDATFRQQRAQRAITRPAAPTAAAPAAGGQPDREIHDQQHSQDLTAGVLRRRESQPPYGDPAVDEAYDGFGATYTLYWQVFTRDSIDGHDLPLIGCVHFGTDYDNAFWDGRGHMFFGDGDGQQLKLTTASLDVIGHELTHGVTQYTANLTYSDQPGALNESVSDVMGSLVKQYAKRQTADAADWLIGAEIVGPLLAPALRSLKAPGTANRYDTQVADMDHYVQTSQDNGGVHTNSGIPNHAFYVTATTIGGYAWEQAGRIWYDTLTGGQLPADASFAAFAAQTVATAGQRYGQTSAEVGAVKAGWDAVKVVV